MSHRPTTPHPREPDWNQDQFDPDPRALEAMAAAVRRARRENAGGAHRMRSRTDRDPHGFVPQEAEWRDPEYAADDPTVQFAGVNPSWRRQHQTRRAHHRRSHATARLGIAAGAVLAVLIAIVAVAYWPSGPSPTAVLANNRTHHHTSTTTGAHHPTPTSKAKTSQPKTTNPAPTTTTTTAPSTTTTAPPPAGLHISSLIPASGAAGQLVMVRGTNLFSPDGQVLVRFNGQSAPTDCTTQTICTATVPDLGTTATAVQVTVSTQAGTSNALAFEYK